MTAESEINIFKCLDFLRDNATAYATAKANRVYLEEFRKTKKALCMQAAESAGVKTAAMQERDAYADPEYQQHLAALEEAVKVEEEYRWKMIAAQAKIEAWRTIESSRRYEAKTL